MSMKRTEAKGAMAQYGLHEAPPVPGPILLEQSDARPSTLGPLVLPAALAGPGSLLLATLAVLGRRGLSAPSS
jgi:hypothetical protein